MYVITIAIQLFQFQKVRLKVRIIHAVNSFTIVSIPKGSIKRQMLH